MSRKEALRNWVLNIEKLNGVRINCSIHFHAAFFYWAIKGRGTIVPRNLRTKGNQNKCPKLFFHSYMIFPKFDPLTTTGMALCLDLEPKMSKFIPLSPRPSKIKFRSVSD